MKVLDLRCSAGHVFEGWFGSEDDYLHQKKTGLLECPVCGVLTVEKTLSAPKVQAKSNTKTPAQAQAAKPAKPLAGQAHAADAGPSGAGELSPSQSALASEQSQEAQHQAAQAIANLPPEVQAQLQTQLQAHWLSVAREMVSKAEDVGTDFANEARRIHHGDAPERAIHGQASLQEAKELIDEGVAVLPLPDGADSTVQ